jgi:heterodisulfide reductase subunit B2
MNVAYYPGCSLHKSSAEYDVSTRKMLAVLDVECTEIPDWTCCGSSPAHMMDHLLAQALATRNLRQAELVGDQLLAPCPSCYQRQKNAEVEINKSDTFRAEVNEVLDTPYTGRVTVWTLPEFLMKFVGEEKIAGLVKTDLSRLKVVPYYGCLLGRPAEFVGEQDIEQPMMMDLLLQAAGADVKWWNYKTECCGASVGMPKMEIQRRLSGKIIEQALAAGADAIVTACPLCHVNLDLKQAQVNKYLGTDYKVPVLYLSQVLGLALGLSGDEVMLNKNVVDPAPLVSAAIAEAAQMKAEEARKEAEKAAKAAAREAAAAPAEAGAAAGVASEADTEAQP